MEKFRNREVSKPKRHTLDESTPGRLFGTVYHCDAEILLSCYGRWINEICHANFEYFRFLENYCDIPHPQSSGKISKEGFQQNIQK